ncbi:hypothetical protein LXG23DRAFT_39341 [Yarrowia lipolytica]|nr:hypothetical protein BKA91DRAFT_128224 [Yarrowia lipolytica]KAE8174065.1 hypothetical protein BKA90DRAFT_127268 [Yarrowia lipolytica]KAJ8051634.1 hypothetical protein LXG23DRAFT_39341 [Yarrowia lipolytica]RMI95146.1 hypothetical protein BD777DRAFT_137702 [Yarrowia lipolytica]
MERYMSTPTSMSLELFGELLIRPRYLETDLQLVSASLDTEQLTPDISPTNIESFESRLSRPSSSQMSVPDSVLGEFNGSEPFQGKIHFHQVLSALVDHSSCPWSYREIRHELIISKKQPLNGGKGPQIQSRTPHSREIYPGYS